MRRLLVMAVLLAAPAANANPLDAFGFGARAMAMGGAYTSLSSDSSANYYNPAGLAQGEDLRFDVGYLYAKPELEFTGGNADVDRVSGLQGGLVLPGELFGMRFGVGLGLYVLDDRITRVRSLPQQQPRFVLFDNRLQRLFISANLAIEPVEHLYIGGGVTFFSDSVVDLDVTGTVSLVDSTRTQLQAAVGGDLRSARYPAFGALYAPDAPWSLGLVYREEFNLNLRLDTDVTGQVVLDTDPENPRVIVENGSFIFSSRNANHFTPRQLVLGASHRFGTLTIAADLGWYQWSRYPAETSQVEIALDLEDLDFSIPPIDDVEEPDFSDLLIPRIGLEARVYEGAHFSLDVRGGYFFEDSPAPDQPGRTNYADSAKHGVSFGVGMQWFDFTDILPRPLQLDIGLLYLHFAERIYLKDDPADLIGDYTIDGHALGMSAVLGLLL